MDKPQRFMRCLAKNQNISFFGNPFLACQRDERERSDDRRRCRPAKVHILPPSSAFDRHVCSRPSPESPCAGVCCALHLEDRGSPVRSAAISRAFPSSRVTVVCPLTARNACFCFPLLAHFRSGGHGDDGHHAHHVSMGGGDCTCSTFFVAFATDLPPPRLRPPADVGGSSVQQGHRRCVGDWHRCRGCGRHRGCGRSPEQEARLLEEVKRSPPQLFFLSVSVPRCPMVL